MGSSPTGDGALRGAANQLCHAQKARVLRGEVVKHGSRLIESLALHNSGCLRTSGLQG